MCAVSDTVNQVVARPPQLFPREVEGGWGVSRSVPFSWWLLTPLPSISSPPTPPPPPLSCIYPPPQSAFPPPFVLTVLSTIPFRIHFLLPPTTTHIFPPSLPPSLPASISLIKIHSGVTAVKPAGCTHAAFILPLSPSD